MHLLKRRRRSIVLRIFDYGLIVGPLFVLILVGLLGIWWYVTATYEVVISGGRVIDPETGTDRVMYIGINHGKIAELSEFPLLGRTEIPAKGKIVGPGFIDVVSHSPRKFDQQMALLSGVTTIIDGGVGTQNVAEYRQQIGKPFIHIGVGVNVGALRPRYPMQPADFSMWIGAIDRQIKAGAGTIIWDVPTDILAAESELMPLMALAGRSRLLLSIRLPVAQNRDSFLRFIDHIVVAAQGADATVILNNVIPASHIYVRAVLARLGQDADAHVFLGFSPYSGEIVVPNQTAYPLNELRMAKVPLINFDTGERVGRGGRLPHTVIAMVTPISVLNEVIWYPRALVVSNGRWGLPEIRHPRYAGTFPRILNKWVVCTKKMTWGAAFELMSGRPADVMSVAYPALKAKGKLRIGGDADLIVVDPRVIEDWATYQHPVQPSRGIVHVIVNGRWVVRKGQFVTRVRPGDFLLSAQSMR